MQPSAPYYLCVVFDSLSFMNSTLQGNMSYTDSMIRNASNWDISYEMW